MVLPLFVGVLYYILELCRIALLDEGKEQAPMYNGGEEAPLRRLIEPLVVGEFVQAPR